MKRPLSLIIISIVQLIVSSLSLVSGVFLLLLMTGTVEVFSQDLTQLPLSLKGLVVLGLAISVFGIVASYGLWTLKRWGWMGSIAFQVLCMANNGLGILAGQPLSSGVYFSAALCTGLIVALYMPNVRELFAAAHSASDAAAS